MKRKGKLSRRSSRSLEAKMSCWKVSWVFCSLINSWRTSWTLGSGRGPTSSNCRCSTSRTGTLWLSLANRTRTSSHHSRLCTLTRSGEWSRGRIQWTNTRRRLLPSGRGWTGARLTEGTPTTEDDILILSIILKLPNSSESYNEPKPASDKGHRGRRQRGGQEQPPVQICQRLVQRVQRGHTRSCLHL